MIYQTFNFARINFLQEDMAELIFYEGIEVTKEMIDELHAYLKKFLKTPFSILINKLNDYSYRLEAKQSSSIILEIHAVAIVCYNGASKIATDIMINLHRDVQWNVQTFHDRESAIRWLQKQQSGMPPSGMPPTVVTASGMPPSGMPPSR